jgi:hypothetical protein
MESTIFVIFVLFRLCHGSICPDNSNFVIRSMPDLAKKLKLIQLDCGQVCDTNIQAIRKEKYYDYIEKNVDCLTLFESPILEQTAMEEDTDKTYKPPAWCELPLQLRQAFTYNDRIKVSFRNHIADNYQGRYSQNFLKQILEIFVALGLNILRFYRPKVFFKGNISRV